MTKLINNQNKYRILKRNLAYLGRFFLIVLFFIGFIPAIPEFIALRAGTANTASYSWLIIGLVYILGMNEVDIYIISWPLKETDKKIAKLFFPTVYYYLRIVFYKIKDAYSKIVAWVAIGWSFVKNIFSKNKPKRDYKELLTSLEYLGIFICAITPGLGRVGNLIYVLYKDKLKYGRYYIYLGGFLRFLIFFGILSFLWSKIQ